MSTTLPKEDEEKNSVIEIEIHKTMLYSIRRTIKFKRYVDYNFTFDSCLPDNG